MAKKFKPVRFPQDESAHSSAIEWWYWNGRLQGDDGRSYAFMDCLFKSDVKKLFAKLIPPSPFKLIYFHHSLLTDIRARKMRSDINFPVEVSDDSFRPPLLYVNHAPFGIFAGRRNCFIEETSPFTYRLRNRDVDLTLVSRKTPLLEGGQGFLDFGPTSTYYYSLTDLQAEGRIRVRGQWIKVTGKCWMDHQWSDSRYSQNKWNWFSIQLDQGREMVCFEYFDRGRSRGLATVIAADGRQEHLTGVLIKPIGKKWVSPKTKAAYPTAWNVKAPARKIDLNIRALVRGQEMIFGPINYWEGPTAVTGKFDGHQAKGQGFMELVGYHSRYTDALAATEELGKAVSKIVNKVRKKLG